MKYLEVEDIEIHKKIIDWLNGASLEAPHQFISETLYCDMTQEEYAEWAINCSWPGTK
jgi:hypothetical protein